MPAKNPTSKNYVRKAPRRKFVVGRGGNAVYIFDGPAWMKLPIEKNTPMGKVLMAINNPPSDLEVVRANEFRSQYWNPVQQWNELKTSSRKNAIRVKAGVFLKDRYSHMPTGHNHRGPIPLPVNSRGLAILPGSPEVDPAPRDNDTQQTLMALITQARDLAQLENQQQSLGYYGVQTLPTLTSLIHRLSETPNLSFLGGRHDDGYSSNRSNRTVEGETLPPGAQY